jgi:hypothetical protein
LGRAKSHYALDRWSGADDMSLKKKITFSLIVLCLTSISALQSVESQTTSTVFINSDGSVSGTTQIQHSGNHYILTGDIIDQVLVVECNNIVVDGGAFTLQGAGGWGTAGALGKESLAAINLTCSNVIIENFKITGWEVGIYGAYNNNTVANCFISETQSCIAIYADNYNVVGNYLANSISGVLDKGNNDVFSKNWIVNDWQAFLIFQTSGHVIDGNRIENNTEAMNTSDGEGLQICQNDFINNEKNVAVSIDHLSFSLPTGDTLPAWDNNKEGNYWSNYTGVDANIDGIGDTPYVIRSDDVYTVDRYPLVSPFNVTEPLITSNATIGLPSSDDSATPSSNAGINGLGLPASTQPPSFASAVEKNTQLQVILGIISAALAAYLIVLVDKGTFGRKNKQRQDNPKKIVG